MPEAGPTDLTDAERLLPLALSRPHDALAQATALLARRPGPDSGLASYAHQARGIVLRDSGQIDEGIAELRTALRLARESGIRDRFVDVQATLGITLGLAGHTGAGLAALDDAVAQSKGVLAGRVLMRRASLLNVLGRYAEALVDLRRAIALLHRGGDLVWEARARSHRFGAYAALGQAARADQDLVIAERLFAAAGQELESAMTVANRGDLAFQTGDLPASLRYLDEAAVRYAALGVSRPNLAVDRCAVLLAAGLAREALAVTDRAIRHATGVGLSSKTAVLLFTAAQAALAAGEPATAIERATAARDLFRAQRRPWWLARASFVLVQARHGLGEPGGRLRGLASRIADQLDKLGAEEAPTAHLLAGRLCTQQGHRTEADRHLGRAARLRHRGPTFARAAGWLAQALRAETRGDARAALVACRRGLVAAEEHQRTLGATELRAHAAAYGIELAAIAQRHAVHRGDARMMLLWSERWRAGALAAPPAKPPDDRQLAADLAALRHVMHRLDVLRAAGQPTARLEQDRVRLEESVRARTRRTTGARRRPDDGNGDRGIRSGVGRFGRDQSGVEPILYGLGDHRLVEIIALDDMLYAVTVVGRRVRMHAVGPISTAVREVDLARFMVRRLAHGRPAPSALGALDAAGRRLQDVLLGPAAGDLDGGPVIVVPPGRLHSVPWALLPSLRHTPMRVAPSAATWLRAGRVHPPQERRVALVIGPGLQGSATEVEKIGQGYADAVVLRGASATADRVLSTLDGAWTAHIAAHGVFRAENPLFSALLLDDGPLTGYDLGRLRRAPFRLVLSSCESAAAAYIGADELLGMVSTLLPLGTTSLLASVVPVNDAATAQLMVTFHDRLRAGDPFPEALVAAQAGWGDDPVAAATAVSFVALGR